MFARGRKAAKNTGTGRSAQRSALLAAQIRDRGLLASRENAERRREILTGECRGALVISKGARVERSSKEEQEKRGRTKMVAEGA